VAELTAQIQEVLLSKTGPRGLDGIDGERGPRGYRGEVGPIGKGGSTGAAGQRGADGGNGYCALWDDELGDVKVPCPQMKDAANAQEVSRLKGILEALTRQVVISEMSKEQRIRYEGGSGLTQTRGYNGGDKAYHESSYTNSGFANFHNHANTKHTVGMGEVSVVLNGVEFWTRHNDYNLMMPDPASTGKYHANKYIEQPPVPGDVLKYEDVDDQAEEMRRWFHAWQDEDVACPSCKALDVERVAAGKEAWDLPDTTRSYTDFFKPVLCVMEGAWIKQTLEFTEAFESDRHFVDAKDWRELYDKNRFLYQSGRKTNQENLPFLPLSVRGLEGSGMYANETEPLFANWEYRIICTPLQKYLPTHNFRVVADLAVQMGGNNPLTREQLGDSRMARFDLNFKNQTSWVEGKFAHCLLDELMEQVPGKDGYGANLMDDSFGATAAHPISGDQLNTAFYSRYYGIGNKDAMGRSEQRRGFNDPSLWSAMTTADKVQGVTSCVAEAVNGVGGDCTPDMISSQKWTWAVPLEIVYTTPLANWNPYNLKSCGGNVEQALCDEVRIGPSGDRTGGLEQDTAYNGVARNLFFITPETFFAGGAESTDAADTSGGVTGVIDPIGVVRKVRASGAWIHWPKMKGFKKPIRQRYPIMPIHSHGATAWKEVKALQDIVIDSGGSASRKASLDRMREERMGVVLKLSYTNGGASNVGPHDHTMHISGEQLKEMDATGPITVTSSLDNGHTHSVKVMRETIEMRAGAPSHRYKLIQCDDGKMCGDAATFKASHDALHAAVLAQSPWAFYTDADTSYETDGETAVWKDVSGNGRDSIGAQAYLSSTSVPVLHAPHPAPYKQDVRPDLPAVVCNERQGLLFPNGSVPTKFTIFARAKFVKASGMRQRKIVRGAKAQPEWYVGWNGYMGMGAYDGQSVYTNTDRVSDDSRYVYHTLAGRSSNASPIWIDGTANGHPIKDLQLTPVETPTIALAIGAIAQQSGQGSDFAISDLIIFDQELSDKKIAEISNMLQNRPARAVECCWDEHLGINVE
jgi:hypothetical protein